MDKVTIATIAQHVLSHFFNELSAGVGVAAFHLGGERTVLKVIPFSQCQEPVNYTMPYDVVHLLYINRLRVS